MNDLTSKIKMFLATNPTEEQIEEFYINQVLPIDKRSINEILYCKCENPGFGLDNNCPHCNAFESEHLPNVEYCPHCNIFEEKDIYNCWLCGNEIEYIDNGICIGCHTQTRVIN